MSVVTIGILTSIAGPLLVQFGFSDACSGEITGKVVPLVAMLPGALLAQWGRVRLGGVNKFGVRV